MSRTMKMPVWIGRSSRPRVLVETPDVAKQIALERILTREGYAVLSCSGPEGSDDRCTLVDHGACDGVSGADVVVHAMRPHDPRNAEVLRTIIDRNPDLPVIVEAPRPYVESHAADFAGCRVVFQPLTAKALVDALEDALAERT